MDQRNGWISHTDEFGQTLQLYLIVQMRSSNPDDLAGALLDFPGLFQPAPQMFWDVRAEMYAEIYARAAGDIEKIPASLRKFYEVSDGEK